MHTGVFKNCLKKITKWLKKKNYTIILHNGIDSVCFTDKKVYIGQRSSMENQIYSLLHECGHILQHQKKSVFNKSFKYQHYAQEDKRKARSYAYRISVLEEEIDAWKRGKKLAYKLKIDIDENKFEKYKAKYTMTYVNWAASQVWEWQC